MEIWITIFYLFPALICTGVVLFVRRFLTNQSSRYWIFTIGMTLSWTPTFITAWHSVGVAQLLLAMCIPDWLSRESLWEILAAVGMTFGVVWTVEKRLRARAERRREQSHGA
jgi:hypothetical protein